MAQLQETTAMKILVIAVLVVAAAGWPIPDDSNGKSWEGRDNGKADLAGHHQHSGHYVHQAATASVQPTPEVQQATAAFMSAWNEAAARAAKIQSTLVKSGTSSGQYVVEVPRQVEATNEVERATSEFMAAWNQAARRAYTVEHAVHAAPQPVQETADVKRATAEFMSAWEAAARQASAIKQAVSYTDSHHQVDHTAEVKKATADFMAAWNEAASRVPQIKSTMYTISGTVDSPASLHTKDSGPRFTPSVEQATAEFMRAWHAAAEAAKAAQDTNVITKSDSHSSWYTNEGLTASSHSSAPASSLQYQSGVPQPVKPTPEVERATAAFMAAWNEAAARAKVIESTLVKSSWDGQYTVEVPRQVQETEEVKRATAQFTAAWNEAASRASTVKQAVHSRKESEGETYNVEKETSEFVSAWGAAAERASDIRREISYTRAPEPVDHTDAVKRATAEFMAAWKEAADRVPRIKSTMYSISGAVAAPASHQVRESATVFSPSVEQATAEFMRAWHAAAKAAADAPDTDVITGSASVTSDHFYSDKSSSHRTSEVSPHEDGVLQPVRPTPEVERATAAFMAAWNKAADRAVLIESTLAKKSSVDREEVEFAKEDAEAEEVKKATDEFTEAWNEASQHESTIKQALHSAPKPVKETEDVERATSEFMSAWETAAQQASGIGRFVSPGGAPQPVDHTAEVKMATQQFLSAWKEAARRVPKIESSIYRISGTKASPTTHHTTAVSVPQFTPSVAEATAEFTKAWNAAAAGTSHRSKEISFKPVSQDSSSATREGAEGQAYQSSSKVTTVLETVQPTPEVQSATASFMAAWNAAAERANKIQSLLVKSSHLGQKVEIPQQAQDTDAVKVATEEFMASWNAAAQSGAAVEQAFSALPQQTADVQRATAEFMAAWHAAAEQASAIKQSIPASSGTSTAVQGVATTQDVQRATADFMAAWNQAAARVPKIETTMYTLSGTGCNCEGTPAAVVDTPEVLAAREAFMTKFREAQNAASRASASQGVLPLPKGTAATPSVHAVVFNTGAPAQVYTFDGRLFAPVAGLPKDVKEVKN